MNDRSSFAFRRPRPTARRALHSSFALPILLLGVFAASVLAGCSGIGSDPLLAASVYGHPISFAAYGRMVSVFKADAAAQNEDVSWQVPDARPNLAALQQSALDFLVDAAAIHQEAQRQHLAVSTKDVEKLVKQFAASLDNQASQSPSLTGLQELARGAHEALKLHLSKSSLYDLLAGRPTTAEAIVIVARNQLEQQALLAHGNVPTVHIRIIETATLKNAQQLEQQVRHGADFGQLARQHSLDQSTAAHGGEAGTFYIGELSIFNKDFDKQIFDPTVRHTQKVEYAIFPYNGKHELFEITQRSFGRIADIKDSTGQTQANVWSVWLDLVIKPAGNAQEYAAIDATPTPTPQGP